jgi:hypothetical protein
MLFRAIITFYCENNIEDISALCGAEFGSIIMVEQMIVIVTSALHRYHVVAVFWSVNVFKNSWFAVFVWQQLMFVM